MSCLRSLSPRIDFVAGRLTCAHLVWLMRSARRCGPLVKTALNLTPWLRLLRGVPRSLASV
eukprot:1137233-Heterocapsa_arctica.AAC.1